MKKFVRILTFIIALCMVFTIVACGEVEPPVHSHIPGEAWHNDATQHWNVCLNGECNEKQNVANHTPDAYGVCTVCGYDATDVSTLAKAIEVATARGALVTNGNAYRSLESEYYSSEENVIFEKAEYATHVFTYIANVVEGEWSMEVSKDFTDTWYIAYGEEDDQVWVYQRSDINDDDWNLVDYDFQVLTNEEATKASLGGYKIAGGEVVGDYEVAFYGAEQLLKGLYEFKENATAGSLTETMENGVYGFTFDRGVADPDGMTEYDKAYRYTVNFTLGEAYTIANLDVTIALYNGSTTIEENAVATMTYTYNFDQVVGAYVNCPLNPAEVLATEFALETADGTAITDTVTLDQGVLNDIVIVNAVPSTADFALDKVTVTAIDDQDMPVEFGWAWEDNYYTVEGNTIKIKIGALGTYTVTIATTNVEKTLTVEVAVPVTRELGFTSNGNPVTTLNGNVDSAVNFFVVANAGADASATVTVTAPAGSEIDTTLVGEYDMYSFTPDVVGTYTVTAVSTVDDSISATLTVTVAEAMNMADVLNGTYTIDATSNALFAGTVTFVQDAEPTGGFEITGTATLEMDEMGTIVLDFEYHSMMGFQCTNGNLYIELDGFSLNLYNEYFGPFPLIDQVVGGGAGGGSEEETSIADTLVDNTYSAEISGTTWYITFTKYEEEYICKISTAPMDAPGATMAQYTYAVGEPDNYGDSAVTLTYVSGVVIPFSTEDIVYNEENNLVIAFVDGRNNPPAEFTEYNLYA